MGFDALEYKRRREEMRRASGCKNPEHWCGHATCRSECPALIFHGPGHQSKGHCELTGPHDQHMSEGPREVYRWTGMNAFSGYFDESPE